MTRPLTDDTPGKPLDMILISFRNVSTYEKLDSVTPIPLHIPISDVETNFTTFWYMSNL